MRKRKIPSNRIVCPARIWEYFFGSTPSCDQLHCCYHCSKFRKCQNNGCAKDVFDLKASGYPENCPVYPLTWKEGKTILFYVSLFQSDSFSLFDKLVEEYIKEEKKNGKKEKK